MILGEYILKNLIGEGSFGQVYYTIKRETNEVFATKKIEKKKIMCEKLNQYFINEIDILEKLNHPNIMKLYEIKTTFKEFYLITEHCNGGTLAENLENYQKIYKHPFRENQVIYILKQLADAISYLHKNNIIHRDLKLENVLLHYENEEDKRKINILNAKVKIIDFGFAKNINQNNIAMSVVGSPLNMAPDLLHALVDDKFRPNLQYNEKVDIWAMGVIVFTLLIGKPPFSANKINDLCNKVDLGIYAIPKDLKLSKECINLLNGMLMYDVKIRLSVEDILKHDFLVKPVEKFELVDFSDMDSKLHSNNLIFLDIKKLINLQNKPAVYLTNNNNYLNDSLNKKISNKDLNILKQHTPYEINLKNIPFYTPLYYNFNPAINNNIQNINGQNKIINYNHPQILNIPNYNNKIINTPVNLVYNRIPSSNNLQINNLNPYIHNINDNSGKNNDAQFDLKFPNVEFQNKENIKNNKISNKNLIKLEDYNIKDNKENINNNIVKVDFPEIPNIIKEKHIEFDSNPINNILNMPLILLDGMFDIVNSRQELTFEALPIFFENPEKYDRFVL